jgi:hypothetical protein
VNNDRPARAIRTARSIRFGHPFRATAIASFLSSLVYRLLLASATFLGLLPIELLPLEVLGAAVIALGIVAATARHEARFAGLRWRDYERMVIIALALLIIPLVLWPQ